MDRYAILLVLLLASSALAQSPFEAEIRPRPVYDRAVMAEQQGNARAAVDLYMQAAQAGDGRAAYRLGEIYEKGLGAVRPDAQQSVKWYNAARILGHPPITR